MNFMSPLVVVLPAVAAALLIYLGLRWSFVAAEPDEWLLRIRNGKLVNAGIGVSLWRLPGEVIARFSSTVQRVKFTAQAYSREHVAVTVDGFVLWTVQADGDGPFRAFSRLGIANLDKPPRELKNPKHLLTGPQYHAFQALLVSELQRQVGAMSLTDVLSDHGGLVEALDAGLQKLCSSLGIVLTQVELSQASPLDAGVLKDLAAQSEEAVREQGTRVRGETAERLEHLTIESATRTSHQKARARYERERAEAQAALDLEREKAALFEAQVALQRKKLEDECALGVARLESEHTVKVRQAELRRADALAEEKTALEVTRARQEREEAELQAALDKTRREAIVRRDAMIEIASAEERKSQAVRDYELAQRVTDEIGQAMSKFHEPRWISIGQESPLGAMVGMVSSVRELLSPPQKMTPQA
jgi:low affinity Fe/Cu permease